MFILDLTLTRPQLLCRSRCYDYIRYLDIHRKGLHLKREFAFKSANYPEEIDIPHGEFRKTNTPNLGPLILQTF